MRLFVALDIDESIREGIARFAEGVSRFAPDARWVKPESLHVTLKFVGEQPDSALAAIKQALAAINGTAIEIHFHGYGFFPTAKAARVFWIGMQAGPQPAALAAAVDQATATLGVPKEDRAYRPHLTLARGSGGSGSPRQLKGDGPNRAFQHLQERLSAMPAPAFGTLTAHEFFLYQSQLSPKGSKYTKLERFALK